MKGNRYLIFGVIFLAVGITMLMNNGSRVMAYGDFALAIAFFALSTRGKKPGDDPGDGDQPEDDSKDE